MGTYQKKTTETIVLQANLIGEKKIFFFFCASFFGGRLPLKILTPTEIMKKKTKTTGNPQYWPKGDIMGIYRKKTTEIMVLQPNLLGEKKYFFFFAGYFLSKTASEKF